MKCDGHCAHKRDHCRSTFVIGFTEADIRGFLDGSTSSVPMKVVVSGNCVHIAGVSYRRLNGVMRHEIVSQQSCGSNGKYSNPRPKDLFLDNNYIITPTSKNALAGVRNIKQAYNLKSEMTKNLHSAWGINGKCKFEDLNKIICETRKEDRDGRLLLHKMVMRWLSQTHDYFVDTCGLRRTQAMLSIYGQQMTCDSQFPDTRRNILC
jgi:hypothetical protein